MVATGGTGVLDAAAVIDDERGTPVLDDSAVADVRSGQDAVSPTRVGAAPG